MRADPVLVLVIEDDPATVFLTHAALDHLDVATELIASLDGDDALVQLQRFADLSVTHGPAALPDVVVLDLGLPGTTGDRLLAVLRGDPRLRHLPVIVSTGRVLSSEARTELLAAADVLLPKPYSPATLAHHVGRLAQRRHARVA